jgi:hypothetical protein
MGVIKRQPSEVFFKELMSFVQQGCSMPNIVNIICPTHFLHLPNMSVFFSSTNVICLTLLMSFCQHFLCVVALVNINAWHWIYMCYHKTSFTCLNCVLIFYCNMLQNCCWWSSILIFNYVIKNKYEIGLTQILPMCNGQNLWRCNPQNWICMCYQKTIFQYLNSAK